MRQRRVGGVLAALCVAAGTSGVLTVALLAPSHDAVRRAAAPTRSGWPIGNAFSSPRTMGWIAADPNAQMVTGGSGSGPAALTPAPAGGTGAAVAAPAPAPPAPAPAPASGPSTVTATPAPPVSPPPESFVSNASGLPPAGEATAYGCSAALAYLSAYAAPGFWLVCPGYARGHQALTACQSGASQCSVLRMIVIADPCPNAYMNEASNSWALMGESDAPLDPYGSCA